LGRVIDVLSGIEEASSFRRPFGRYSIMPGKMQDLVLNDVKAHGK